MAHGYNSIHISNPSTIMTCNKFLKEAGKLLRVTKTMVTIKIMTMMKKSHKEENELVSSSPIDRKIKLKKQRATEL